MVRIKQTFQKSDSERSFCQQISDLSSPTSKSQTGSKLPLKKAVEPVLSSGLKKRSKNNLKRTYESICQTINLDNVGDDFFNSDCKLLKPVNRVVKHRVSMSDEANEIERKKNRLSHANRKSLLNNQDLKHFAASDSGLGKFYELGQFNIKCFKCESLHFPEEAKEELNKETFEFESCCKKGKLIKLVDFFEDYPEELKALFSPDNPFNKKFISNIRRYNSMFAFASLSCFRFKFPTPGPPCYKIQGQIYHKFNQFAMPANKDEIPTNGQLYFLDSEEASDIREKINKECDPNIINYIERYIRENNKFVNSFQLMKDVYEKQEKICRDQGISMPEVRLLFSLKENFDKRRYNIPQSNEVCAILVCDANDDFPLANIVVYPKGEKKLKNIYPLDKCVEPMSYPLLYPKSSFRFSFNLQDSKGKNISLCDFVKFFLFVRDNEKFVPHFFAQKLFQQWVVDQAARIEWNRLEYIRTHQNELCSSSYLNVEDFLKSKAIKIGAEIQKKVILPSTFTGGPRSMHEHFMDAMSIVNETGKPDLFITFTCNPNDPDILKCLFPGQTASDRPDIVTRVFNLKKNYLLNLILNKQIFGEIIGFCWVIEYQKRGLPHLHLLITLSAKDKWRNSKEIDNYISAEIPDEKADKELFDIVKKFMFHGPCSENSLCWDKSKKKCGKKFPKAFRELTEINEDGYPLYKRPNNNRYIYKKGQKLTNQYVVPYNSYLLKTFRSHINVERVSDILVVKYLYDYIYKGYDAATIECVQVGDDGTKKVLNYDEVSKYLEARYLSPCEACWRIFKFPLQGKSHAVDKLDIHLENMQKIIYGKNASENEIKNAAKKDSTLTAYFKFCQKNQNLNIKYIDMPKYCTWLKKTEKYYLRYLLLNVPGKSFEDLRTVNGVVYDTYAKTCLARGLARDDDEWYKCLEEASFFSRKHPQGLRTLFVNILIHCEPKYPGMLWESFKEYLIFDLIRKYPNYSKNELFNLGLCLIDQGLKDHEKSLKDFCNMPQNIDLINFDENEFYDPKEEYILAQNLIYKMNEEQKEIIEKINNILKETDNKKCIFIDGPGGTGKSYVLKTLYHLARSFKKNICNMAYSGIAATQLQKGRTLHNRFKLPLNIKKTSTSGIEIKSKEAEEIKNTDIFVWDEAPMASRFTLDIIDKKLKEIMNNQMPFGGKIFVLSGDFRQCLPIKEFGTRADPNEKEFAQELIKIGNGISENESFVSVPDACFCKGNLSDEVFEQVIKNENYNELYNYAILSPFNSIVDNYNEEIMKKFPGETKTLLSIDETETNNLAITPEILNSLKCPNFPNHSISLKEKSMIMLVRNLNVKEGLCNGTRLQVANIGKHVLNCIIKSGDKIGETTLIPRITLIEDKKFPFVIKRHQFPIRLAFAFTINKSQSQTFEKIGIDYTEDPFSHGQTYVSLSRAKSWEKIRIKVSEKNKDKRIKNIVWREALLN
uniref:ATP-dependent DNA helicase n=1 Tax=Meloidogyne enterolobii TaxID=390850 RepID=A0A6V7X9C0_MELEN|nr:unnamed protein product [Meloidogyne enterolobii]